MKNGDKPISPVDCNYKDGQLNGVQTGHTTGYELGLTKREHFAAMAMQGMLANPNANYAEKAVAIDSVIYADALLKALEQ